MRVASQHIVETIIYAVVTSPFFARRPSVPPSVGPVSPTYSK